MSKIVFHRLACESRGFFLSLFVNNKQKTFLLLSATYRPTDLFFPDKIKNKKKTENKMLQIKHWLCFVRYFFITNFIVLIVN